MNRRFNPDNCVWITCCCGCLTIIALLQTAILAPIITTILVPWNVLVAVVIFYLRDVWYTFYVLAVTKQFGPKLTTLGLLLLWPCIFTWPLWVLLITLL